MLYYFKKGKNSTETQKKKKFVGCMEKVLWLTEHVKSGLLGFPGGAVVKNPPDNAGDTGSSPGLGRSRMPRSN